MTSGILNLPSVVSFNGGSISGSGVITFGDVLTLGIRVNPVGTLQVQQNLSLTSTAQLDFKLAGLTQNDLYPVLQVEGTVSLDGALRITFGNGFEQQIDDTDTFTILTAQGFIIGAFTNVASGSRLTTADNAGSFLVIYDGQNVILSDFAPVPEPFTVLLMGFGSSPSPSVCATDGTRRICAIRQQSPSNRAALFPASKPRRASLAVSRSAPVAASYPACGLSS